MHTTNYFNTFIEVAVDTKATLGMIPPMKGIEKTVALMQYEMLCDKPYKYTSDEVLFQVFADRKCVKSSAFEEEKKEFFSKGQPCFRASPLTKSFGFGVHANEKGKIALYGMESAEYQNFLNDPDVKKIKAMRSSRK
jgi:hypothetical protein